jgi:predicted N-acyltransferase
MPDSNYSVQFVETEKAIPADLWQVCFPPPLEGHWWYRALEASGLERQFRIFYALLSRDGVAVGIAPLFVTDIEVEFLVPRWLVPFLAWLGKALPALSAPTALMIGSPCSDEGAVALLPDIDRQPAFAALHAAAEAEARRRGASLLAWKDFPSSYEADLRWLAERAGMFRIVSFPGTLLALPGSTREGYFASLSTSRRHNLKRKLKRSAQAFDPLIEVIQSPDAATIDELYALFEQTRARAKTTFENLDRRFFAEIAKAAPSHFIILRERDTQRAVAFKLCFVAGDCLIDKYVGLDYGRPRDWFLFFRLTDIVIDFALARGLAFVQSGQTGYSAKLEQGHRLYPLTSYGKHSNATLHGICKWVAARVTWATLDRELADYLQAHPEADAASR